MTARINTPPYLLTSFVAMAVSIMWLADAGIALAQSTDSDEEELTPIVVTGSRIARRDFSSPSPISTLSREALDGAAQPTLEETLNRMPQITPDLERTANNPGDGRARVNLRGLGSNRTLVMLNGRRLAPSGVDTSVDVNNLPQTLSRSRRDHYRWCHNGVWIRCGFRRRQFYYTRRLSTASALTSLPTRLKTVMRIFAT